MTRFEDLVAALEQTDSAWGLSSLLPELKEGLTDLLRRLQALEKKVQDSD